jgi:hypothetical protein
MPRVTPGTPDWGDDLNADLDGIEEVAQAAFEKVVTVPAGSTGWTNVTDGTLWVEYTP